MVQFLPAFAVILLLLLTSFAAMAIGLILRGKILTGGCGSHGAKKGKNKESESDHEGCGFCAEKKKLNICSSENKGDLKEVSKLGMLGRFD